MKKRYFVALGIIVLVVVVFLFVGNKKTAITDFESCVKAGNLILESYPEQCRTLDGKTFVNESQVTYSNDGVSLYQDLRTNEYACFGCSNKMCVDILIDQNISILNETEDMHCNDNFEIIQQTDIVLIKENFGSKILYDMSQNIDNLKIDCNVRGGTFNECGDICAPDAEVCVKMCGFTCENIK